MASHLRRTDDLERLKTRSIVLQNSDGTYPATNGAMYVSTGGTVAVSASATVDGSGNLVCKTATVGTGGGGTPTVLTVNGNALVHGNATVTGFGPGRGTVGTDYVDIISHDPSNNPTYLYALHNTLMWQDERHRANNLLGWKSRMDPSGGFVYTELSSAAPSSQIVSALNDFFKLLSSRHAFVTYTPLIVPDISFNQPRSIAFSSFLASNTAQRVNYTFTQPAGDTNVIAVLTNLNNQLEANGLALRFTYNSGTGIVTISPSAGFGFAVGNVSTYGSASLFLAHLGISDISGDFNYTSDISGADISGGVTGMTVPSAPAAPSNAINITTSGFTVTIPTAVPPIRFINIYLNGVSQGQTSINAGSYTFFALRPNTPYTVQATFLSDYDESSLSTALTVTTAPIITSYSVNMLTQPGSAVTPYTGRPVNYTNVTVATVGTAAWPANLTQVSQIKSVEMQYYSGFSVWNPYYDSDARFVINPDANGDGIDVYYAYSNRVNPVPGDVTAVGSPNPVGPGPSLVVPDSTVFADQTTLQRLFGVGGNTDTIDKSNRNFAWFCGYPASFIQNCQMTKFIINYTA